MVSVPPVSRVTALLARASRPLEERVSVPASTVVAPLKVLAPERVKVPAPFLVRSPVPLMTPL